jgi:hypothetical protein
VATIAWHFPRYCAVCPAAGRPKIKAPDFRADDDGWVVDEENPLE